MLKPLENLINTLNDATLVARTQNFFGVRFVRMQKANADAEEKNGKQTNQNENEKYNNHRSKESLKCVQHLDGQKCYYAIENPITYWFFLFITHMGNEVFYITFLPTMVWLFVERFMYLTCLSWGICMFVGQATKDLIKYPRPATPPVVKIEQKYFLEYGFPSTHAMAAVNISYTMIRLTFIKYSFDENVAFGCSIVSIALCSILLVSLSRIYLGMHSYLDVIGGILYSLFLSHLFLKASHVFVYAVERGLWTGTLLCLLLLFVCLLYPNKVNWSPARADTFLIMGVAIGVTLGYSFRCNVAYFNHVGRIKAVGSYLILKRTFIGILCLVVQRFLSKAILYLVIKCFYSLKNAKNKKQTFDFKTLIKSNYILEMFYYIFCYGGIGFSAVCSVFCLFEYLDFV